MLDIIAIGSATKDIFLDAKNLQKGNNLVLPLGGKIELKNIRYFSGGGGVNAATTFALQGLKTAFCGVLGQDLAGQEIIDELNEKGIDTSLVKVKQGQKTDIGLIFHAKTERTILLFHGASRTMNEKDIDWQQLKNTKWLYLAPLWGQAAKLTPLVLSSAKHDGLRAPAALLKIAMNPSLDQLKLKNIKEIIKNIDVLLLNNSEASFLTGIKPDDEKRLFSAIYSCARPSLAQNKQLITVITKGKEGATTFDGRYFYQVPAPPVKVADATGAGDSFGSGFVAGLIQKKNIEESLKLAMTNAIGNIQVFGANEGLLEKGQEVEEIIVKKVNG